MAPTGSSASEVQLGASAGQGIWPVGSIVAITSVGPSDARESRQPQDGQLLGRSSATSTDSREPGHLGFEQRRRMGMVRSGGEWERIGLSGAWTIDREPSDRPDVGAEAALRALRILSAGGPDISTGYVARCPHAGPYLTAGPAVNLG